MKHLLVAIIFLFTTKVFAELDRYVIEVKAKNSDERSLVANTGVAIEKITKDTVTVIGTLQELKALQSKKIVISYSELDTASRDFPQKDSRFHNYTEYVAAINKLKDSAPDLVSLEVIGNSLEGREIYNIHITSSSEEKPGIVFMGNHHAREHLSLEMPFMLAEHIVKSYKAGDAKIKELVDTRDIHIIPLINPDGVVHDIASGKYKYWRKNRKKNSDNSIGVDLNRNYSYKWGGGGASKNPGSETYRGEKPFSEPESQAVRDFVESHKNITILLSFHSFSELILYPWGHTKQRIQNQKGYETHKKLAETMSKWNGYTPKQSSGLYVASGDTTDWSWGQHGIISFTFELDPKSFMKGGFYPGATYIDRVFNKNLKPALYLIEYSDNPYRVLEPSFKKYGFNSPVF